MKPQDWLESQLKTLQDLFVSDNVSEEDARLFIHNFTSGYVSEVPISSIGDYQLTYGELVDRIVENKLVGIWVVNGHGETVYFNQTAIHILGVTTEEAEQAPYHRYIFQPNNLSIRFQPVLESHSEVVELSYQNKFGVEKHLLLSESPLFSKDGSYNGCICLFSEITQRKIAEQALQEVSRRYRAISEMISDYVYSMRQDADGRFVCEWMSGAFEKTTGYTLAELRKMDEGYVSIIQQDYQKGFIRDFEATKISSTVREYQIISKSGTVRWIQDTVSLVFENGEVKLLGAALDITDRKESEEVLRKEREFNALISNTIPIGLVVFDVNEQVIYANNHTEEILGKTNQAILKAKGLSSIFWGFFTVEGKLIQPGEHPLQSIYDDKQDVKGSRFALFIDNRTIYVSVNASTIWQDGEFRGVVATYEDITTEIQAENEILQAKKMAEESDRLKSAFLANISHEIRTPLNGIVGFSDMLQQPELTIEQKSRYVAIIGKSSRQLIQIVNDIIDIAKLESNQFSLKESDFCVNEIFNDLDSYFTNELSIFGKQIKFIVQKPLSDLSARILIDGKKLELVFIKLLNNALKFTTEGQIEIGYSLEKKYLRFFVKDSGIGISEGKENIIFRNFRQADERSTRNYGGNGLGLSISKGIVELMGGTIWYDSKLNEGTTFYFTIPYIPTVSWQDAEPPKGIVNLLGKKILIVDDDPFNLEFLKEILSDTNAILIEAIDGHTAVEQCLEHKDLSIILMDVRLPDISGTKATALIKTFLDVPVIAQTANALTEDRIACYEAGCCDFISKPFTKSSLLRIVGKHIL